MLLAGRQIAKDFWKNRCEHYHLLRILFNKIAATGFFQISSNQAAPNSDEERELDKKFRNAGLDADLDDDGDDDTNNVPRGHEHTTRGKKRPMQEEWSKGKNTPKKMDELSEMTQRHSDSGTILNYVGQG
ncbi:hypothetical protein SO802_022063 [Lithocarpus litseifolius]|uniref:Uncharacterized protein n=1 Tax=Lithocarpus litseifolius TaxID=425828 RepID=A0AAW2CGU8_9ROSI